MSVQRYDTGALRIDALQRTPQGGLRVPAALTRSGCAPYSDGKGSWVEYRPADEVARAESLATLQSAPVTDDHPPEDVTTENWASLSKGLVEGLPSYDAETGLVLASVLVQDAKEVELVAAGERVEISCGYQCDVDLTPGVAPDGTPYDRVQRNIRYNHVALGPRGWGRMGPRVRLRIDGAAYLVDATQLAKDTEKQVEKITIRKREFKLDAEGVAAAQQAVNEETKKADADAELVGAVKGALEQALAKIKELESVMGGMVPADQVQAEVAALDSVRTDARRVLGDVDLKGKSKLDLQRAVLEKVFPGKRFDSCSKDVLAEMFPLAIEFGSAQSKAKTEADTKQAELRGALEARTDSAEESPLVKMQRETDARFANAFKR